MNEASLHTEPGIHLLIGPPNAGKLGELMDWWVGVRDQGPLLVGPTRADADTLAEEILDRFGTVFGPAPAGTFDDLARDVTGRRPAYPSPLVSRIVAGRLLTHCPGEALSAVAGFPGTPGAIVSLLTELGDSGLSASEIGAILDRWASSSGDGLARDVAWIYRNYVDALERAEVQERWQIVAEAADSCEGWHRPVGCYGFTSFTPAQRRLLRAVSRTAPVVISLAGLPAEAQGVRLAGEAGIWEPLAASVRRFSAGGEAYESEGLRELNRRWHGGEADAPVGELDADGSSSGVRLLCSAGRRNEVELVAEEIVRLLAEGLSPGDIVVAAPELEPYHALISHVFSRIGIPHQVDARISLGQTGLGLALRGAVNGVFAGDRSGLLAYLRSPYSSARPEEVDRLEFRFARMRAAEGSAMVDAVRERFGEEVAAIEALALSGRSGILDGSALVEVCRSMLVRSADAATDAASLATDAGALSVVERGVAQIEGAVASGLLEGQPTRTEAMAALMDMRVRLGREQQQGVVHCVPLRRIRGRRHQVLFMLDLVEGRLPRSPAVPPIVDPGQRQWVNREAGVPLFGDPRAGEERALFETALSRPWRLLCLSTRDADEQGTEAYPSPYFTRAAEIMGRVTRSDAGRAAHFDAVRGLDDVVHRAGRAPSFRDYLRACAAAGAMEAVNAAASFGVLPEWRRGARITSPLLRGELAAKAVFSAGELESYVSCPFRWFIEKFVRPETLEREMDSLAYGTLVHGVLRDVYGALQTEGLVPLNPGGLPRATELLEAQLARSVESHASRCVQGELRLVETRARRHVLSLLAFDAHSGSRFVPYLLEHPVGTENGVDIGGLRIRGRIDRIDADSAHTRGLVVDYKSGGYVPPRDLVESGDLQVLLYVLALRVQRPELRPVGAVYAALASGKRGGIVLDTHADDLGAWACGERTEEEFEQQLGQSLEQAREAADGIRSGFVAAECPNCPSYCELPSLCRSGRRPVRF